MDFKSKAQETNYVIGFKPMWGCPWKKPSLFLNGLPAKLIVTPNSNVQSARNAVYVIKQKISCLGLHLLSHLSANKSYWSHAHFMASSFKVQLAYFSTKSKWICSFMKKTNASKEDNYHHQSPLSHLSRIDTHTWVRQIVFCGPTANLTCTWLKSVMSMLAIMSTYQLCWR